MIQLRALLVALAPVVLHALAREVDRALGLVLRAELAPLSLPGEVARALAAGAWPAVGRIGAWIIGGAALAFVLAHRRARVEQTTTWAALSGRALLPLLLRPAITLLALLAVAVQPSYPYGFTLPVALTQDWAIGQDLAALAVLLAMHAPPPRLPAPRRGEVLLLAFLGYAVLVPPWAWHWDGHPGNEPKYLRQAVAIGQWLTFDAERVSAGMEELGPSPLLPALGRAASGAARESGAMLVALWQGRAGRDAIRASRITRQTIRGKEGGVYYVLAPGPSLLLAPALRLDRALNIRHGTPGRLAVTVLSWCALAALLVTAVFSLVRDATRKPGAAAGFALGFALLPPFLFYPFQFYPEMPAALVLAGAFSMLALGARGEHFPPALRRTWLFGWLVATLPWLHQKFLPVWGVLVATALLLAWLRRRSPRVLLALALPQLLGLFLTALYNFAITGSARPDALFLAWGPAGVTSARVGQGLLGLLLDARYGILPWVPILIVVAAGIVDRAARRLAIVFPAALAYDLTVASADNWAGAVCNLGRYLMPLLPLAVTLVAVGVAGRRARSLRRGGAALALVLAAWSALFAWLLWHDPLAANDSALLLAKSRYADGNQYLPNLFIRHWSDAAPGLSARIVAWVVGIALAAAAVRRAASPPHVLAALALVVLACGWLLERWPSARLAPSFANALALGVSGPAGTDRAARELVFFDGAAVVREDEAILGPGEVTIERRSPLLAGAPASAPQRLRVTLGGTGTFRAEGLPPLGLRPGGGVVDLPTIAYHVVNGRDGRGVSFARLRVTVSGQAVLRFGMGGPAPAAAVAREPVSTPD